MRTFIASLSTSRAAWLVGVAFITSVVIVTLVDDFLLPNFVVPGDTLALERDIDANGRIFGFAVAGYLIVLLLDTVIGLALYVVLKPAGKNLAWLTGALRLLYVCTLLIGVLALTFQVIEVYSYASIKLIGYIFFALHIFVLGYAILKSDYMPKFLGILLIIASITYIVFFVDIELPKELMVTTMLTMAIAELSLSIWLLAKRRKLPD